MNDHNERRLDDTTIETVVRICDEVIERLEAAARFARTLDRVEGFGDLVSARQLAQGFARKARGTPASLHERLLEHQAAFATFRDHIHSGGGALINTDAIAARTLDNQQ